MADVHVVLEEGGNLDLESGADVILEQRLYDLPPIDLFRQANLSTESRQPLYE